jgi:hypothetical protein
LLVFSWKHLEDHQLYMVPSEACCTSQPQAQEIWCKKVSVNFHLYCKSWMHNTILTISSRQLLSV